MKFSFFVLVLLLSYIWEGYFRYTTLQLKIHFHSVMERGNQSWPAKPESETGLVYNQSLEGP